MATKTNTYELTYILNSVISDDQIADLVSRIDKYITENGGSILDKEVWGTQRLAYPIEKKRNGYYVDMTFEAPGELIARLERAMEINDNVLRYLTLKMDRKMIKYRGERKKTLVVPVSDIDDSDEEE